MENKYALRNIKLFYWFQALKEPLFWGPILILYIQRVGQMELSQIYFMESVVVLLSIFLEIPSGALADLIGRKKTITIGVLLFSIDISFFAIASAPWMIWTANIIWLLGYVLVSGADTAFLYDSLKEIGQENSYKKIMGTANANRLLLIAISSLLVGFLAEIHLRLPLLLSIPGSLLAWIITLFFKEPRVTEKYNRQKQMNLMRLSIIFVANHKKVKWIIGFTVLIGAVSKIWFFTYNPYFELVNLDLKYYGLMFFALNIVAAVFSRYADQIEKKMGIKLSIILMLALIAGPILLMGTLVATESILLILFQNVVRGYMDPFLGHFLHRYIDSKNRATVISIKSAVSGLTHFLALSLFGWLLNIYSLPTCLQILGLTTLTIGVLLICTYQRIFKTKTTPSII